MAAGVRLLPMVGGPPPHALLPPLALIWGVNIIIVKAAFAVFQPLAFNAVRFPLAAMALITVTRLLGHRLPPRRLWVPRALYGFLGNSLYQLGFIEGLGR